MSEFLRSVIQQDVTLAASTTLDLIDLPVNPISHMLFTLRALNTTATLTNYSFMQNFLAFITNLEVLYKGQDIIQGSLADLMVMNALLTGYTPGQLNVVRTNSNRRSATFMLSFSRVPFWHEEAFPATSRGELQLRITTGAAPAGLGTFLLQLETLELLNANPSRFCRYITYTGTATATGDNDRDLPRGNPLLGVMLFGTTQDTAAGGANTIETAKLLVDNRETYYSLTNWETLHAEVNRRIIRGYEIEPHTHATDVAIAPEASTFVASLQQEHAVNVLSQYGYLDFDPLNDGSYLLQTAGHGRVSMRINFGDTAAMRFMPVELMTVGGAPATA